MHSEEEVKVWSHECWIGEVDLTTLTQEIRIDDPSCAPSPWYESLSANNFPHISIPLPLNDTLKNIPTNTRMPGPHLLRLLPHIPQPRSQEPRTDAENLDSILLQLVIPVDHHHVERRLAAAVRNRFEVYLLGPPGRLRRRGEVVLARRRDLGETGHEQEAGFG